MLICADLAIDFILQFSLREGCRHHDRDQQHWTCLKTVFVATSFLLNHHHATCTHDDEAFSFGQDVNFLSIFIWLCLFISGVNNGSTWWTRAPRPKVQSSILREDMRKTSSKTSACNSKQNLFCIAKTQNDFLVPWVNETSWKFVSRPAGSKNLWPHTAPRTQQLRQQYVTLWCQRLAVVLLLELCLWMI